MAREIRLEIEVPGTPEQVWETIATGPGISAWFVPTRIDGDTVWQSFGAFGEEEGEVRASEPPRRVLFGQPGGEGMAFEWLVEARDGGTCVVRLVNSGFGDGDDGDFDGMTEGWGLFLRVLRGYLTHFPGLPSAAVQTMGHTAGGRAEGWARFSSAVGVTGAGEGDRVTLSVPGAPPVEGVVEWADPSALGIVLDGPVRGQAFVHVEGDGDPVMTAVFLYLYGDGAQALADELRPAWTDWMAEHFPLAMPQPASNASS